MDIHQTQTKARQALEV